MTRLTTLMATLLLTSIAGAATPPWTTDGAPAWLAPGVVTTAVTTRDATVAPDGRSLYYMSTRNDAGDGADDADLWCVVRRGDGWGEPEPVGPPVNTGLQEFFPSLALAEPSTSPAPIPPAGSTASGGCVPTGGAFPGHRVTPASLRVRRGRPGCGSTDLWWVDARVLADYQP